MEAGWMDQSKKDYWDKAKGEGGIIQIRVAGTMWQLIEATMQRGPERGKVQRKREETGAGRAS